MTKIRAHALQKLAGAMLLVAACPMTALAEGEENTGMKLLLPNMAEFVPACIAFAIIWIIMAKFAWPMVLGMMEEREAKIQGDLDSAAEAAAEAQAAKHTASEELAEAHRQADEIIAEAKRDAERLHADMMQQAQAESAALVAKAHDVIAAEREKAMSELAGSVVDLSVEIAGKVIGASLDEDAQRDLAAKYLAEVGSLNDD
jgi:F-type H+-transporting ATPase subunit b